MDKAAVPEVLLCELPRGICVFEMIHPVYA